MALSKIDPNSFDVNSIGQYGGRRNLIINGAMQVAQRGTSFTSVTSSAYHLDRWLDVMNMGTWTIAQSSDAPDGFSNSLRWDCTTANASPSSSSEVIFVTRFEGQDLQHLKYGTSNASSLTLSFWVKSNKTGTYTVEFDQYGDRQISRTYTINSADTWEYKTLTVPGDTGGSIDNDNSAEFQLLWWLGAGSNLTSGTLNTSAWASTTTANRVSSSNVNLADSTNNDWSITGIQLEVGSVATPFENRSYGEELLLCQRYYERIQMGTGTRDLAGGLSVPGEYLIGVAYVYTTTRIMGHYRYITSKRTVPSGYISDGTSIQALDTSTWRVASSTSLRLNEHSMRLDIAMSTAMAAAGNACELRMEGSGNYIGIDAEL